MMGARDEEKVEILNDQKVEFLNEQEREEEEKEHEHWNGQVLSSSQVDEKDCENTPHTHKGSCCNHKSSSKPAPVPNANELDLWHASQRGALQRVQDLLQSGVVGVNDRGEGNVTALHWAAINNHLGLCQYLLDRGAEVDALGGDLIATPLHWAARAGHVQIVTLLFRRGADLFVQDAQGYNALHLAVHAGHLMMIVYLITIGIPVDSRDTMGRTPLMWSAYQGNCMEGMQEIIKSGALLDLVDSTGYTALHWSVISLHYNFAKLLLKEGADYNIKDPAGKTPQNWAKERESEGLYLSLIQQAQNKDKIGNQPFSKVTTNRILTACSYFMIPLCFWIMARFAIYISLPLVIGLILVLQKYLIVDYLLAKDAEKFISSSLTSSICEASLFYVFLAWIRLFPYTYFMPFCQLLFLASFVTCIYNLYRCSTIDPGFIPRPSSLDAKSETILSLADEGQLNERKYCTTCQIRKPLRSKHCKICDNCVAKFDHHCPWTNSCIGWHNHRQFMLFCISLIVGSWTFVYLSISYMSLMVPDIPFDSSSQFGSCIFPSAFCQYVSFDFWIVANAGWAFFQSLWVLFVVLSQIGQIFVAYTTNESINYHRFEYLMHPDDLHAPAYRRRYLNRFDMGPIANCIDFWSKGAGELKNISWMSIYEIPIHLEYRVLNKKGLQKDYSLLTNSSSDSSKMTNVEKMV